MKKAPRSPSRWTSARLRTLLAAVPLSGALGACTMIDNNLYGSRQGTVEYPGSGASPGATAVYIVKEKDTVDAIASRFSVSTQSIIDRNKLQPPYQLRAGQSLDISGAKPDAGQATATASAAGGPVKSQSLAPPPGSGQGEPPRSAAPAAGEPTPLSPAVATAPPAGLPPRFEWPLQGRVLAGYGPRSGGQKNDGIDIQADKGAAVKAADAGTVVYAGSEVRGMGNLLLVSHAGGYITAYAHNESLLVKKGEAIKKGQTIARVGNSGGASEPQLHFEVRRGNRTIDPMTVLPAQ